MKKNFMALLVTAALLIPTAAFAEGFAIYEWSPNGSAMAENYMFAEDDAAVIAYNPAGITKLKGKYFSFGGTYFDPHSRANFDNGPLNQMQGYGAKSTGTNRHSPVYAGEMYYTQQLNEKNWIGLGIFPRFGNALTYNSEWEGRYDTVHAAVVGMTIQPTYGFRPTKKLGLAAGLDISYFKLNLEKKMPLLAASGYLGDADVDVQGSTLALGWFVSAMYDFDDKTSAAITYRSKIKQNMEAEASASAMGANMKTGANGSVTVPDSLSFGIGHKFNDRTRIEASAVWTNWSTYDVLKIDLNSPILGQTGLVSEKDWKAVWRFGVGLEHKMNEKWTFMCGYNYDASPVPDERMDFTVPTGNRHRASIGFKYKLKNDAYITVAYSGIFAEGRDVESKIGGADFTKGEIETSFTNIISVGYNMKL